MKKLFIYINTLLIFSLAFGAFAQTKFRGEGMDNDLELFSLSASSVSGSEVDLEFSFNNRLDPSSVNESLVRINGSECLSSGKITFSKDGTRFKIRAKISSKQFSLSMSGVESQDGIRMSPVKIDSVEVGYTYTRRSSGKWERS